MIAFALLLATMFAGLRWPGFLIPGLFYGYTADALGAPGGSSAILATAFALIVLAWHARKSLLSLRVNALDVSVFAFLGWHSLSAMWMLFPDMGVAQIPPLLFAAGSVYVIFRLLGLLPDQSKRLAEVAWGFTLLGGGLAALTVSQGSVIYGRLRLEDASVVGIAQPIPMTILAASYLVFQARGFLRRSVALLCLAAAANAAFLTGTRGAVIALAGGLGVYLLRLSLRTKLIMAYSIALIGPLVGIALSLGVLDVSFDDSSRLLDASTYGSAADASSAERFIRYDVAWDLIQENPLFGAGLGGFAYASRLDYPHNVFLEIWSQSGLIGLLLFAAAAWIFLKKQHAAVAAQPSVILLVAFVASGFAQQQVSFHLATGKTIFLVGYFASVASDGLRQAAGRPVRSKPGPQRRFVPG